MSFNIDYYDLVRIIKAYGYDGHTAIVVADYLDECIDYDLNLTYYLWNTLPYNVHVFNTKKEAEEYIDNNLCIKSNDDYKLYESENYNGVYLEVY